MSPDNLTTIARLLESGDGGLWHALETSCNAWDEQSFHNVVQLLGAHPQMSKQFLTESCGAILMDKFGFERAGTAASLPQAGVPLATGPTMWKDVATADISGHWRQYYSPWIDDRFLQKAVSEQSILLAEDVHQSIPLSVVDFFDSATVHSILDGLHDYAMQHKANVGAILAVATVFKYAQVTTGDSVSERYTRSFAKGGLELSSTETMKDPIARFLLKALHENPSREEWGAFLRSVDQVALTVEHLKLILLTCLLNPRESKDFWLAIAPKVTHLLQSCNEFEFLEILYLIITPQLQHPELSALQQCQLYAGQSRLRIQRTKLGHHYSSHILMSCLAPKERIQYFRRWLCAHSPEDGTATPLTTNRLALYFGKYPAPAGEARRLKVFLEDGIREILTNNADRVQLVMQPPFKKAVLRLRDNNDAFHFHDLFLMLALLKLHFTSRVTVESSIIGLFEMVSGDEDPASNINWRALAYWLRFVYV